MGFLEFAKFIVVFAAVIAAIIFIIYPIDAYLPIFGEIFPLFEEKSLFDYLKENSSAIYFIVGTSLVFYVTWVYIRK